MSLSLRLRRARELAGISARELDRLARLTEGHTSLIESGERSNVEARTATALATTLGLSLDWLITGKGRDPIEADIRTAIERARAARASSAATDE